MRIDNYKFGEMTVDSVNYRRDLIIFPDHVVDNWRRRSGHDLVKEDILDIKEAKPDCLFIGTGKFGLMKVSRNLIDYMENLKMRVTVLKTDEAVDAFNNDSSQNKIGAFHLTC